MFTIDAHSIFWYTKIWDDNNQKPTGVLSLNLEFMDSISSLNNPRGTEVRMIFRCLTLLLRSWPNHKLLHQLAHHSTQIVQGCYLASS